MNKSFKISLVVIGTLILLLVSLLFYSRLISNEEEREPEKKITGNIESYGYTLDEYDSDLFKEEFNELKKILENDEIDYEAYAEALAKLFTIDLYTISTKLGKSDIGGVEYIYSTILENYKLKMMDTLYKEVKNYDNGKRKQKLPIVTKAEINSHKVTTYKMDNKQVDAHEIIIELEYQEDLGYDSLIQVTLVKENNKLSVVEFKAV